MNCWVIVQCLLVSCNQINHTSFSLMIWAPSSEFVSSSIPSWQILTAHAQPLRGARDLAFCLKVPLDSLLVWASSEGSGETARMRRLPWTFTARIGYKYQICLMSFLTDLQTVNYYSIIHCYADRFLKWKFKHFNKNGKNLTKAGAVSNRIGYELITIRSSPSINTPLTAIRITWIVGGAVDHWLTWYRCCSG